MSVKSYTPRREDPALLDVRTVGLDSALKACARAIDTMASTASRSHVLLIGPRGAGKSHVLSVALHRAEIRHGNGPLPYRVARLPEDMVGVGSAVGVLQETLRALTVGKHQNQPANDVTRLVASDLVALEQLIHDELNGSPLLLVVENLDRVWNTIGAAGQHDLRAWTEGSSEVSLIAAAPSLFEAVQRRDSPWFSAFEIIRIDGLTLDQGAELVRKLALQRGDLDLAAAVDTPYGRTRLQAIHQLAGGSPRIWTIFAQILELSSFDELANTAESLLEELVPYYQQRLWDLSPIEQQVLVALARNGSATPAMTAESTGLVSGSVRTTLTRLEENSWVKGRKAPGTDQRGTWYEVAEPLLRHHIQYRETDGVELRLIIELLTAWFSIDRRRQALVETSPQSLLNRYLIASLISDQTSRFNVAYSDRDINTLMSQARLWQAHGYDGPVGTPAAGQAVLQVIEDLQSGLTHDIVERVGEALLEASFTLDQPDRAHLQLVAWGWMGKYKAAEAVQQLGQLRTTDTRLQMAIAEERSYLLYVIGRLAEAVNELEAVVVDRTAALGETHPDNLRTRHDLAYLLGEVGRTEEGIKKSREVIADSTATLGPTHGHTLASRHNLAFLLGNAGRLEEAVNELEAVVVDRTAALGATHELTLTSRHNLAFLLAEMGQSDEAIKQFQTIVMDASGEPLANDALIAAAQVRVRSGALQAGKNPLGVSVGELLRRVAFCADARALAALPAEIRLLLTPGRA